MGTKRLSPTTRYEKKNITVNLKPLILKYKYYEKILLIPSGKKGDKVYSTLGSKRQFDHCNALKNV